MNAEKLSVSAVVARISHCKNLSCSIKDGDKEPSWDGHIYVYPNDAHRKSEMVGRVPVQVKGKRVVSRLVSDSWKFSVDVSDLRNYENEGGAIYFGVQLHSNRENHIFYKVLLPYDLHDIFKNSKNNKTKTIELRRLPDDDKAIEQIFLSFLTDKKLQASRIVWTKEQAIAALNDGASIKFHVHPKNSAHNFHEIMRESTTQPFLYLYAITKDGVSFPFDKFEYEDTKVASQLINIPIFVGDIKHYDHFNYEFENGKAYVSIGNVLRIPIVENDQIPKACDFNYAITGTLSKRIADSDFLLALSKHNHIRFGDSESLYIGMENMTGLDSLIKHNDGLKELKCAFEHFGVSDEFDMDGLSNTDYENLNNLIHAAKGGVTYFTDREYPSLFCYNARISNISFRILAKKNKGDDGYTLHNAFTDNSHIAIMLLDTTNNERIHIYPWSMYLYMSADDFLCSNINYKAIVDSVKAMKKEDLEREIYLSKTIKIGATAMLLEILNAYDSQTEKNGELLQLARDIADILLSEKEFTIINRLQVIKRQGNLSHYDIGELVRLKNEFKQNAIMQFAISILLDEKDNANEILNNLSDDEKKLIVGFPIMRLL